MENFAAFVQVIGGLPGLCCVAMLFMLSKIVDAYTHKDLEDKNTGDDENDSSDDGGS